MDGILGPLIQSVWLWVTIVALAGGAAAVWFATTQRKNRQVTLEHAKHLFHLRREWLEADFFSRAGKSGKPRGLIWSDIQFADEVAFARDRTTTCLRALVAITIRFTAVEGGDMEDNPNVGNPRAATAVFLLEEGTWRTDGRAIFNLNPVQAIEHFREELELVE